MGRIYAIEKSLVNQSTGTLLSKLVSNSHYDPNDRVAGTQTENGAATESAFDGAGRQFQNRTVTALAATKYTSGKFNYRLPLPSHLYDSNNETAMTGGNDGVLTLSHQVFDAGSSVTESHTFETAHGDTDCISFANSYIRRSVYSWYDNSNRVTATGDYGTSGAIWAYFAAIDRPGTAPSASSSSVLVTKYQYHVQSGRPELVTDPKGTVSKSLHDDLGRVTHAVQNYIDFTYNGTTESNTGGSDKSQDQVVKR